MSVSLTKANELTKTTRRLIENEQAANFDKCIKKDKSSSSEWQILVRVL